MELNRILELLAKKMGGAASEKEIDELQALLNEFPEHAHLIQILESIETNKLSKVPYRNEAAIVQESWNMMQKQLREDENSEKAKAHSKGRVKKMFFRSWMTRAAVAGGIILVSSSVWFALFKDKADKKPVAVSMVQQLQVPNGAPDKKILPDGSEVWVNAGSHIRYSDNLQGNTREIYLEGEAFFKVKHDPEHPFIVHAGNISVRALGTEFNVEAYANENTIKTTLINGKVQITMEEKPDQKIILAPKEKLTVTANELNHQGDQKRKDISYKVEQIENTPAGNSVPELAWIEDRLAFQNESFNDLSKRMERRFNMHIVFRDATLKEESLTGTFENETIQKALNLLQMTTPFRYRIERDSVFLNR